MSGDLMKTEDFNYELPEELIAQSPLEKRDNSKLMILDKNTGDIKHTHFNEIIDELDSNDILVMNDTKVIPARLYGLKEDTNAAIEILMLKEEKKLYEEFWEVDTIKKMKKEIRKDLIITIKK